MTTKVASIASDLQITLHIANAHFSHYNMQLYFVRNLQINNYQFENDNLHFGR